MNESAIQPIQQIGDKHSETQSKIKKCKKMCPFAYVFLILFANKALEISSLIMSILLCIFSFNNPFKDVLISDVNHYFYVEGTSIINNDTLNKTSRKLHSLNEYKNISS